MACIELENFGFAYAQAPGTPVLLDVNWRVEQGEFALLGGSTGCGKTTLLRLLHPALAPVGERTGGISVNGVLLGGKGEAGGLAPGEVGYVSQHPAEQIVCDSVWHELAFGMESTGVSQDAMRARVAEVAHYFGIGHWLHEPTASLSGGQMQLLNLAAALASGPGLLLLDEPTAQLDPVAEQGFLAALARVNRELGVTVVVATHAPHVFEPYATNRLHLPQRNGAQTPDEGARAQLARIATAKQEWTGADGKPALQLAEAYARYGRDLPWVLRGLNLSVGRGTIHALVGGNGSGKTTALLALAGVQQLQRGKLSGQPARQGYLPQDPKHLLVCDTVAEELAEWQDANGYTQSDIRCMAKAFGLAEVLGAHPFDVSGGQQQLLALAKLLLARPDVLLLDEPTKGLDAPTARLLADLLGSLRDAGTTVVLATHDLAFVAAVADAVTLLFDGQDALSAPPADFFGSNLFLKPHPDALASLGLADAACKPSTVQGAREAADD